MIKRKRRVLSEASQIKEAYERLEKKLREELNLSDIEITYAIEFYKEVKKLDLFDSAYFTNFEYEGELFDLRNVQKFAKYPEAFHDIVMIVLHNPAFLDFYKVSFNGVNVTLEKITVGSEDSEIERQATTPFDDYKVAEDSNYYTFFIPNHNVGSEIRTFFAKLYPNDERITMTNEYYPTWCIISSSGSSHFNSEKSKDTDVWLITYTKKNPADLKNEYASSYGTFTQLANKKFGEVYMMDKDGTIKNKNKNIRKSDNYGYHNFSNNPYYGNYSSALNPATAYNYGDIDLDNPIFFKDFTIEAGILTNCYVDNKIVRVPQGVTEIAEGAFKNLHNINEVILPPSTRIIRSGAFQNTRELYALRTTNNLEIIESNAFTQSMSTAYEVLIANVYNTDSLSTESKENVVDYIKNGRLFVFGVIDTTGGKLSISKPSRLRYMPKVLSRATKMLQDKLSGDTQEESKRRNVKESFRVKRQNYEQEDLYSIEGSSLVVDALPSDVKELTDLDLSRAPNVKRVTANIRLSTSNFPQLRSITFPEGVEDISKFIFNDAKKVRTIDLSKTALKEIPESAFSRMSRLREVKLPDTLEVIQDKAFESSGIDSIEVTNKVKVHPNAFKNCPFMKNIFVDNIEEFKAAQDELTIEKLERQKIKIQER